MKSSFQNENSSTISEMPLWTPENNYVLTHVISEDNEGHMAKFGILKFIDWAFLCVKKKKIHWIRILVSILIFQLLWTWFIREIRCVGKNRTGPNKLVYEELFSTFKLFCGQDVGHITHAVFTVIAAPHFPFYLNFQLCYSHLNKPSSSKSVLSYSVFCFVGFLISLIPLPVS